MSTQQDKFFFIWKDMDFQPVNAPPNDPEIPSITINLNEQLITVYLPENCGLVTSRTISRRVDSIVRTGIYTPEDPPRRVGMKFKVEILGSKERISPTLLVSGHEYSKGKTTVEQEESVVSTASPFVTTSPPTSTSLTPSASFETTESPVSTASPQPPLPATTPVEPVVEPKTLASSSPSVVTPPSEHIVVESPLSTREKITVSRLLGELILEVLKTCDDIYLTRLENNKYHLESEHGAIVFHLDVTSNQFEVLETSRLPEDLEKKIQSLAPKKGSSLEE